MTKKEMIHDFLKQKKIAIVGVSRSGRKFSNTIWQELKDKGYQTFAVNPNSTTIRGETCYRSIAELPAGVDGLVMVIPPVQTIEAVRQARTAGIKRIWLQQGSESQQVVDFCLQNSMTCVSDECILMHAEPAGFYHRVHRWIKGLFNKAEK
jgi:uncharacterized protein